MPTNRKRPHSLKATHARKEKDVRFRVTDEQKRALKEAAAKEGLDVSAWLRRLALKAAGALPESP